ncbi:MAG: hypothetical protein RBR67_11125 [Desulfobacterium sp.]|nr:hypothetical protein [Desulfobacterium sp.]
MKNSKGAKGMKVKAGSTTRAVTRKKSRPNNPMENIIQRVVDLPLPDKVYDRYLASIPDLLDPGQYDPEEIVSLRQNRPESQVHLLGAALTDKALFADIVEKLPERARDMLYSCVGFNYGLDLYMAELKYIQAMGEEHPGTINEGTLYKNLSKDPDFFLFNFNTNLSYGSPKKYRFEIGINPGLLPYIRKVLPDPARPPLARIQDVGKRTDHLFTDNQEIFKTLPVILSFISQNKLKYAKNSDKILASSLRKMAETCTMDEFYDDGDKDVRNIKTRLIADFFTSRSTWNLKELNDLPQFIKTSINDYFKFEEFKSHRCRDTFEYIKRQERRFDTNTQEKRIREHLEKILELIPDNHWASVCDLAMIGEHTLLNFCPFADGYELRDLYIPMDSRSTYRDREQVGYADLFSLDSTTLPFLRRMMFLFGALGILDLAYSEPTNSIYRECKKPYLSPFDGLKYVRITEFGRYVMGRTKKFTTTISAPLGEIVVDANKTLLSIQGEDPIKTMVLDAVGERINRSSYRVDFNSFLKECATAADVNDKIAFFRANIAENPPAVWERFFEQLVARINPIKSVPSVSVFKVTPDRELLSLLTGDPVLKKHVMRAENHHMVIEKAHIAKVKERLARFGYFVG